jgi:hypothetical protein
MQILEEDRGTEVAVGGGGVGGGGGEDVMSRLPLTPPPLDSQKVKCEPNSSSEKSFF